MALVWYMRDGKAHITIGGGKRDTHTIPYGYYYAGTFSKIKPIDLLPRRPITVTIAGSPEEVEKATVIMREWSDFEQTQEKPLSYE